MEIIKRNTDYAIRALVSLGRLKKSETKSVRLLSAETDVPEIFLRKILQRLAAAQIVRSTRGPAGGYGLRKPPGRISMLEVVENLQGKFAINKCFVKSGLCSQEKHCEIRAKFVSVQKDMVKLLRGVTLRALLEHGAEKNKKC